jgi:hypothetical protein
VKRTNFDSFSRLLVGRQLQSLEKRDFSWFFVFADDLSVVTESPWRLIADDRIATTSEDDGQQFGLPERVDAAGRVLHRTRKQSVTSASIDAETGDLSIEFSGMVRIQLLQMSSGYEAWRIHAPGAEFVCTGGGDIHEPLTQRAEPCIAVACSMKPSNRRSSHLAVAIIHFSIAGFFAYAFDDRFWLWRHQIAEVNTSFITPDGANVTEGGMLWIFPAGIFAILGFLRAARYAFPSLRLPKSS